MVAKKLSTVNDINPNIARTYWSVKSSGEETINHTAHHSDDKSYQRRDKITF